MEAIDLMGKLALAVAIVAFLMAALATRQSQRIEAVERRLGQLPSAQEVVDIRIKLAALEAKQESVLAEVHATRASIRRVEDFLMKKRGGYDSQF